MPEVRTDAFVRNNDLESLLTELNTNLQPAEEKLLRGHQPAFPAIFVMGPLRSGTTLIMQWLANLGSIAYPTNLLSRFYRAPILGSKIQLLLTDERYNYRNEILDFKSPVTYRSENGKTQGALAPNEFWYFWRRFLPFKDLDYLPSKELWEKVDTDTLAGELAGVMDVFQKPLAMKGMILNYNIDFLDQLFDKAVFIHVRRDPLANIESALKARERQMGSIDAWYSFKIPEYAQLKDLHPYEQVAGQIYYINKAVDEGLAQVADYKKMTVQYEDFCANPKFFYEELASRLADQGHDIASEYPLNEVFKVSRSNVTDPKIINACKVFYGSSY